MIIFIILFLGITYLLYINFKQEEKRSTPKKDIFQEFVQRHQDLKIETENEIISLKNIIKELKTDLEKVKQKNKKKRTS
jgi:hypothetical protein